MKIKFTNKQILIFLFLLALILRVTIYNLFIDQYSHEDAFPDKRDYQVTGEQIAAGNWDPEQLPGLKMRFAPGIPLIIAFNKVIFGDGVLPTIILNILLTSLAVFVVYFIGKKLFNNTVGLLMAIWMAVYYEAIKFSMFTQKEPVIYFILPLTLLFFLKVLEKKFDFKYIFLSALSFIILIHVDERFVIYLPVFPVLFLFNKNADNFKDKLRPYVVWVILVFLMMIPWTIRNYYVFDQLVIISSRTTAFTSKLWGENLTKLDFSSQENINEMKPYIMKEVRKYEEKYGMKPRLFEKNEARINAFFDYWQPVFFSPEFIQNGYRIQHWSLRTNLASISYYGLFLPFYIIGLFLLIKKKYLLAFFIAFIPIIHSVLHSYMVWPLWRYRTAMDFIIALTGIWFLYELFKYIKSKINLKLVSRMKLSIDDKS